MKKIIPFILGLPKTIYLNFKLLDFRTAIKLPIVVANNVVLSELSGTIEIKKEARFGMIKIGFGNIGIFNQKTSVSSIQLRGRIIFKGSAIIGYGSRLAILGDVIFGENFNITAESQVICNKRIVFGDNVLISWDTLIMDTDFHNIYDEGGNIINPDKEVVIGNKVWVGCRTTILKGSRIGENTVIAANSCISGQIEGSNKIIGGNPVRTLKTGISWEI